ncbi:hypothetical protein niasHT_034946 [Heterodera trifolii]|uniref:SMP-LTD domain-containing protein n=1 Tax=Heterodera trifolii TaxID=157864 RepID=A0ABD2ICA5_9BILA
MSGPQMSGLQMSGPQMSYNRRISSVFRQQQLLLSIARPRPSIFGACSGHATRPGLDFAHFDRPAGAEGLKQSHSSMLSVGDSIYELQSRVHKWWHKFLGIFRHYRTLPFRRLRLLSVAFLLVAFFSLPSFVAGLLTGVYLSLLAFLFCCVSDPMSAAQRWRRDQQRLTSIEQLDHVGLGDNDKDKNDDSGQTVPSRDIAVGRQKQEKGSNTGRIYKGWMNILSEHYHPHTFHVNSIQTVLVRLDGHLLRISRPERTMLKHCFHIDPTLTEPEPRMISQKIYDLTDAQVVLRPRRLARRRWFSRKYPICIKLAPSADSNGGRNSAGGAEVGMKRCHSLRQRTTDRHSNDNANGTSTGARKMSSAIGADFCAGRNIGGGRECDGEGRESDGADSAGDSVQSESTDDELNLAFYECQQQQQLLSTARPSAPVLSASCPTPTGAAMASMPSSSATTAATGGHRRRRRRTVPPPCDEEEDGNDGDDCSGGGDDGTNGIRRRQCSSSSAAYIFLFARSTREKERWFHQLRQATLRQQNAADYFPAHFSTKIAHRCTSVPSLERMAAKLSDARVAYTLQNAQFTKQLASMIAGLGCAAAAGAATNSSSSPYYGGVEGAEPTDGGGVVWMDLGWTTTRHNNRNANNGNGQRQKQSGETTEQNEREQYSNNEFILLVNLIASSLPVCRDNYWCGAVRNKIQTKLATIHLPYFIETLELSKLDLGTITPQIVRVHPPTVNEWGIWYSDEEIPESPETSPDEEFGSMLKPDDWVGGGASGATATRRLKTGQKLISWVDRIAHTKYFREASELKLIRKMMEEISSMRLLLNVQVTTLEGRMCCNFPPPPSDRLWYAFRTSPRMSVKAVPQVGDRSVELSLVSEWIENKLQLILEKNLVLPNMDDVIIPVCSGNKLLQVPTPLCSIERGTQTSPRPLPPVAAASISTQATTKVTAAVPPPPPTPAARRTVAINTVRQQWSTVGEQNGEEDDDVINEKHRQNGNQNRHHRRHYVNDDDEADEEQQRRQQRQRAKWRERVKHLGGPNEMLNFTEF